VGELVVNKVPAAEASAGLIYLAEIESNRGWGAFVNIVMKLQLP
jgi:hypothetical protein